MYTPVQDYLSVRHAELRPCLGDEQYAELEDMAANMDRGLAGLGSSQGAAFLTVLTLGQFSQEVRIRLLTEKGREA